MRLQLHPDEHSLVRALRENPGELRVARNERYGPGNVVHDGITLKPRNPFSKGEDEIEYGTLCIPSRAAHRSPRSLRFIHPFAPAFVTNLPRARHSVYS